MLILAANAAGPIYTVRTSVMEPTFLVGDHVLAPGGEHISDPRRGDVIALVVWFAAPAAYLTGADSRNNITQSVFELPEEPAAANFESFANVGIVKVLRIPIEEATLRGVVKVQVRKYRCQHDSILT